MRRDDDRPSCRQCRRTRLICEWTADADALLFERLATLTLAQEEVTNSHQAREAVHFKVNIAYKRPDPTSRSGRCWQNLFGRCVIVHGFPIRRRPRSELGLELSLEFMAKLIGTRYLHQFNQHLFFKQLFMMLIPSSREGDCLIWHLCVSTNMNRISYMDHGVRNIECGYDDLSGVRHIVGWCSNMKHLAGHVAGCYGVESSFQRRVLHLDHFTIPLYRLADLSVLEILFTSRQTISVHR